MADLSTPLETLRGVSLFSELSGEELHELAAAARSRSFSAGEPLFLEGDRCQGMFLIARGSVRVFKTSPSGREVLLAVESAPASIAEIPVFDAGPYPASAAAVSEVQAYLIDSDSFRRLCRRHPDVALKILAVVGRRLRGLVSTLERITFGSVRQRLALRLLELAESSPQASFELPETREELAIRLGTVREVVSRNLSRFQAQGLIRIEQRRISIADIDRLRQEASLELG